MRSFDTISTVVKNFNYNASNLYYAIVGGNCNFTGNDPQVGAFLLNLNWTPANANWNCGACLSLICYGF